MNNIWYEQDFDININKSYQILIEKYCSLLFKVFVGTFPIHQLLVVKASFLRGEL